MNVAGLRLEGSNMNDPVETAGKWLETFETIALATVVSTWGSSPVPVGGQLVVAPDGRFEGSVSGGCVDVEIIAEAGDVIANKVPKILEFGVADERVWQAGLPCGGTVKIYLHALHRSDRRFIERVLHARTSRQPLAVLTDLRTGACTVIDPASPKEEALGALMDAGESRLITTAEGEAFLHCRTPAVRVVMAGATHIAQVLASLAGRIGYDVVIVDPRTGFANSERFGNTPVLEEWPKTACATFGLDRRTAVVALTHAAHLDDEALIAALSADCFYVGALGSKKTHAKRLERLRDAGLEEADLKRIHAPVGLDLGAKGPAEIAVAILAEIVQISHGEKKSRGDKVSRAEETSRGEKS